MRFGPYRPRIDEEFSAAPGPYERVFGTSSRVFFGLELDYQALRIPHVGTLGPGVGWGYTSMSAKAKIRGTSVDSAESTSLWIMPFYTVGVLNIDVLARDFGIPLVPYGKLGVGYSLWKAANDLGISTYDGVSGKGHSYGLHYAFGGMVQLDFLNRHSSSQLDDATGINHSYFYMEWVRSNLDGFGSGKHMQVGTSTWVTGLAFEI